jgi:glycosidase
MIDIYGSWIDRFGIDGFRIDTARHAEPEFWQAFVPAMLERARAKGIPNFHIFGEVATPEVARLAEHTRVDKLPSVLDFAFQQAVEETVAGDAGTDIFAALFHGDALYEGGFETAVTLPTFTGNHDHGRLATAIRKTFPEASDAELLNRLELANAMMLTMRGVPTIYAGDEQGFVGDGGDRDAREDMFASKVASYDDNDLIGTDATTAADNFDESHPLFRQIAALSEVRLSHPALTRGRQVLRFASDKPGLLALSRFDPETGREILLAFNTSTAPIAANVEVEVGSTRFDMLAGAGCPAAASAPGSARVTLAPLGYAVCAAEVTR